MTRPPPAPREFPFSAAPFGVRFMLLFGAIWALVGSLMGGVFIAVGGGPWNDWILDARGVTSDAVLLDTRATSTRVNERPLYELTVRAEDTELHVSTTDLDLIDAAKNGTPVRVQWDRQDPSRARLEGERASFFGPFLLIPAFFAVIGWLLVVSSLAKLVQLRALFKDGEPALASVRSVEATTMKVNGRPMFRAKYEFRAGVQPSQGSYLTATPPAAGAELWVLYVASNPSKSMPFRPE